MGKSKRQVPAVGVEPPRRISAKRERVVLAALMCLAAAWACYVHFSVEVLPYDDAYITFRYVKHFFAGEGLVYNAGERVLGVSSPLYLGWLVLVRWITDQDVAVLGVRANAVWFILSGVAAHRCLQWFTSSPRVAAVGAIALLLDPRLLSISVGGMESFLFVALLLFALLAAGRQRAWMFGALAGLAILARPEGIALIPVGVLAFWRNWRMLGASALIAGAIGAAWIVFATMYYGNPIPQSVLAKSKGIYILPAGMALDDLLTETGFWLAGFWSRDLPELNYAVSGVILPIFIAATAFVSSIRQRRGHLPAVVLLCIVAMYAVGNPLVFEWYFPAALVLAYLTLFIGGIGLATWFRDRIAPEQRTWAARLSIAFALAWIASMIFYPGFAAGPTFLMTAVRHVESEPSRLRIQTYLKVGQRLSEIAPQATVAAPEIGALGYTYDGRILDPCGLVSPEAMPFLPIPRDQQVQPWIGAISTNVVESLRPDYVVSMPIFTLASLDRSPDFHASYRMIEKHQLPVLVWESTHVLVYKRVSSDASR